MFDRVLNSPLIMIQLLFVIRFSFKNCFSWELQWKGRNNLWVHIVSYTYLWCLNFNVYGRWKGFYSGGAMEHWKVLAATMVDRQEKNLNSRRSRMAKTVSVWPWWQPFNSFCFETFFPFASIFFYAKKLGGGGRGSWSYPPPQTPVSPTLMLSQWKIIILNHDKVLNLCKLTCWP